MDDKAGGHTEPWASPCGCAERSANRGVQQSRRGDRGDAMLTPTPTLERFGLTWSQVGACGQCRPGAERRTEHTMFLGPSSDREPAVNNGQPPCPADNQTCSSSTVIGRDGAAGPYRACKGSGVQLLSSTRHNSAGQPVLAFRPRSVAMAAAISWGIVGAQPCGDGQAGLNDRDHASLHLRGGVPVGHPHRAAAFDPSTALVAHQLVDHPAWGCRRPPRPPIAKVPGVRHYVEDHCIVSAQGDAEPPFPRG
jgi:hypothetical protein